MSNEVPYNMDPADPPIVSRDFYARDFRVIGHDLEAKDIDEFELESEGANYLVRGKTKVEQLPKNGFARALRALWKNLQSLGSKPAAPEPSKLVYTPDGISRLKREDREKRRQAEAMPTTHSLSQVLRAVGAYLDLKEAHLLRISKQGQWLTLQYEVEQGNRVVEEFMVSGLYDFCVRMYVQRRGRKRRG